MWESTACFHRSSSMADYAAPALSQPRDGHASEDDDEDVGASKRGGSASGKKPRGRPPGSKNKPKPPVVITRESETAMHPVVLELSAGCDVLDSVSAFARHRRLGLSVLSCSGSVVNVTLRHPTSPAATLTLHGRFDILSLSGTFLPAAAAAPQRALPFSVSLAGAQGQVIGGTVAGPLTAAGPVVLLAALFASPEFHRLPEAEDKEAREEGVKPPPPPAAAAAAVYGCASRLGGQQLSNVLWATPSCSRPPPHYRPS